MTNMKRYFIFIFIFILCYALPVHSLSSYSAKYNLFTQTDLGYIKFGQAEYELLLGNNVYVFNSNATTDILWSAIHDYSVNETSIGLIEDKKLISNYYKINEKKGNSINDNYEINIYPNERYVSLNNEIIWEINSADTKTDLEKLSDSELIHKAIDSGNADKIEFGGSSAHDPTVPSYKKDLANREELIEALFFESIEDSNLIMRTIKNYDTTKVDGLLPHLKATECAQNSILQFAEFLEENDPEAIVVFQSDHGPSFSLDWDLPLNAWEENAIDERLSIINFLRVPKLCEPFLNNNLGNVNSVRIALACGINQKPIILKNIKYLGVYEGHQDYGTLRLVE